MKSKDLAKVLKDEEVNKWLLRFEDALREDDTDAAIVEAKKFSHYLQKYKKQSDTANADALTHIYHSLLDEYRKNKKTGDTNGK